MVCLGAVWMLLHVCMYKGQLGTFALIKLLTLQWGTLCIKMKSHLLEVLKRVLTDSNYCFDSLSIRLWSKDLKTLIPRAVPPGLQG